MFEAITCNRLRLWKISLVRKVMNHRAVNVGHFSSYRTNQDIFFFCNKLFKRIWQFDNFNSSFMTSCIKILENYFEVAEVCTVSLWSYDVGRHYSDGENVTSWGRRLLKRGSTVQGAIGRCLFGLNLSRNGRACYFYCYCWSFSVRAIFSCCYLFITVLVFTHWPQPPLQWWSLV